jgi:galactose-1-phosphate uridylyltransferase
LLTFKFIIKSIGLENLPSEIKHHFAEIRNTLEQTKTAEKRISVAQYDLQSIHRQWFNQELEKRKKLLKHEPDLIKRIKNDYNKLEDLSTERIQLAEDSIKLVI